MNLSLSLAMQGRVRNGALLNYQPETIAYKTMVEADDGNIVDIKYVNNIFKTVNLSSIRFIVDANTGVKVTDGKIETMYNLVGSKHATQSDATKRGLSLIDSNVNQHKSIAFTGVETYKVSGLTLPTYIDAFVILKTVGGNHSLPYSILHQGMRAWPNPGFKFTEWVDPVTFIRNSGAHEIAYSTINANWLREDYGIAALRYNATELKHFKNNYLLNITPVIGTTRTNSDVTDDFYIGSRLDIDSYLKGVISGVYIFSSLTETERNSFYVLLENYYSQGYKRIACLGDSTVSAYLAQYSVMKYLESITKVRGENMAIAGQTIAEQLVEWDKLSAEFKTSFDYIFVQIGLNDLNPTESAATALSRYQILIDNINADVSQACKVITCTMTPCKERLIVIYGAINGAISYQKWLDMNEAIIGSGALAITGMDGYVNSHTASLNDGNGNLAPIYEIDGTWDHIHENNVGRDIVATAWSAAIL